MSGREIPFDENAVCDGCGAKGAYDFMGDCLCEKCAEKAIPSDEVKTTFALQRSDGSYLSTGKAVAVFLSFNDAAKRATKANAWNPQNPYYVVPCP